jgi:uncharacterized protein
MPTVRCPVCNQNFDTEKSKAMPFCSERCRLLDLGQWLDEKRGVPLDSYDEEDASPRFDRRPDNGDHERN